MSDDRLIIFDTTLRDGEQSPGASMNLAEKLEIAHALSELGVDIIEAGFPIASPGDFESVQAIARQVRRPVICGLARCNPEDIDRAWEAVRDAERPRIHVFLATSAIHREFKLRMAKEEILRASSKACNGPRTTVTTWSFRPKTRPGRSWISLPRWSSGPWKPAPPRSTSPIPSATRCPSSMPPPSAI